MGHMTQPTVS